MSLISPATKCGNAVARQELLARPVKVVDMAVFAVGNERSRNSPERVLGIAGQCYKRIFAALMADDRHRWQSSSIRQHRVEQYLVLAGADDQRRTPDEFDLHGLRSEIKRAV
jgi:hypothetical protein